MGVLSTPTKGSETLFSVTICAYRKPGMEEGEYHQYLSQQHAPKLIDLLVRNRIVDYTMQHNTSDTKKMMGEIFGEIPDRCIADYDCFIQMVFRDIKDYIDVKNDPHYQQVVMPDHGNFADQKRTQMVTGWFEKHVSQGKSVEDEQETNGSVVDSMEEAKGKNGHTD